jgi:hypothetical protein
MNCYIEEPEKTFRDSYRNSNIRKKGFVRFIETISDEKPYADLADAVKEFEACGGKITKLEVKEDTPVKVVGEFNIPHGEEYRRKYNPRIKYNSKN